MPDNEKHEVTVYTYYAEVNDGRAFEGKYAAPYWSTDDHPVSGIYLEFFPEMRDEKQGFTQSHALASNVYTYQMGTGPVLTIWAVYESKAMATHEERWDMFTRKTVKPLTIKFGMKAKISEARDLYDDYEQAYGKTAISFRRFVAAREQNENLNDFWDAIYELHNEATAPVAVAVDTTDHDRRYDDMYSEANGDIGDF